MAGDARHASHVDADGRQDTAGPSAPAESLVARGALRHRARTDLVASLGIAVKLWPVPTEADHTIPFAEDRVHASYDAAQAHRFFQMLRQADRITKRFQGRFLGKSSPVHFFWGAFDLALARFNGRRASHKATDSRILHEANSHEEISVGFWPGSGTVTEP